MEIQLGYGQEKLYKTNQEIPTHFLQLLSLEERTLLNTIGVEALNKYAGELKTIFEGDVRTGLQFIPTFVSTPWNGSIVIGNRTGEDRWVGNWKKRSVGEIKFSIMHVVKNVLAQVMGENPSSVLIPEAVLLIVTNRDGNVLVGRRVEDCSSISGSLTVPSGHIETLDSVSLQQVDRVNKGLSAVYGAARRELHEEIPELNEKHLIMQILGPVLDINTGGYLVFGVHCKSYMVYKEQYISDPEEWEHEMQWVPPESLIDNSDVPGTVQLFVDAVRTDGYWNNN